MYLKLHKKVQRHSCYNYLGVSQLTVAESLGADSNQQNPHHRTPESLYKVEEHVNNLTGIQRTSVLAELKIHFSPHGFILDITSC